MKFEVHYINWIKGSYFTKTIRYIKKIYSTFDFIYNNFKYFSIWKQFFFYALFLLFLFNSCSEDAIIPSTDPSPNSISSKQDRIYLKNIEELDKTLKLIENKNISDKKQWSNERLDKSFYNLAYLSDSTLAYLPNSIKTLLNEDLEFAIGDSIIWFNNHKLLVLSDSKDIDKKELARLKKSPNNLDIFYTPKGSSEIATRVIGNAENLVNPVQISSKEFIFSNNEKVSVRSSYDPTLNNVPLDKIKVTFEFFNYKYTASYLESMSGYEQHTGNLKIRVYTYENNIPKELNLPELHFTLHASWSYSYTLYQTHMGSNVINTWYSKDYIQDFEIADILVSNGNTYTLYKTNYDRLTISDVLVAVKAGTLKFSFSDKISSATYEMKDINL